ncbi:MAG: glycosyltransferase family 39 protein [Deltaproteobacteria bacterium]|nr:glycosyltransferase family 39 protein [Deltaproteobacteria bacterium]
MGPRAWLLLVGAGLALALAWRPSELTLPPHGEHAWRDADGIGIARCFVREGVALWRPRVMERGATPGVVGMELPLVNAMGAGLMKLLGIADAWARLPCWLALVPLALGATALGRRLFGDPRAAALTAVALVLQPLVLVYSRKCMPELPMLAALVWAVALAHDALHRPSMASAVAAGLLFALAAVLKPTGLAAAIPVAIWAARTRRFGAAAVIAVIPTAAAALWFAHARALEAEGLPLFKLHQDWFEWLHLAGSPSFWSIVLGRVLHTYLLWPTVIWMVLRWPVVVALAREHRALMAWLGAALFVVILFGSHNAQHPYYALPLLVPIALFVGGFAARASALHARPERVAMAFALVFAITALVRAEQRRTPFPIDAAALVASAAHVPAGLTVATDAHSPVVSLVLLDRLGWARPAEELKPAAIDALRSQGAAVLVESSFGGWLPPETRAALPPPVYADDVLRAYAL